MKIKDLSKIKDLNDLREIDTNDVIGLLDELRAIAAKRGTELLGQGRHQARRAIGAPAEGALTWALLVGILVGAATAAVATVLMSPVAGAEARRRLTEEARRVRERVAAGRPDGNGRSAYEDLVAPAAEAGTDGGSPATGSR